MLLRFRVENFRSVRDEVELSLLASSLSHDGPRPIKVQGAPHGVLTVAAIYGANASGKSNVLKALSFFSGAIANSHRRGKPGEPIPVEPFLLSGARAKPSLFEADFVFRSTRYRYGFELDRKSVKEEWLYAFPAGRRVKRQEWFTRDARRRPVFHFGRKLLGQNRVIEKLTRSNSLFLSAAAQNNHPMLLPLHRWLVHRINMIDAPRSQPAHTAVSISQSKEMKRRIARLLSVADLGITGVRIRRKVVPETIRKMINVVREDAPADVAAKMKLPKTLPEVELMHVRGDGQQLPLPLDVESRGTTAFLCLLGPIITTLAEGGVLCVDELDASLHPRLSLELVRMFKDPKANRGRGQLIFNTHDTNLLDQSLLRRDEIWFTEKDREGCTHLYPLSDFAPRRSENLRRGYLQGRFGAVPFVTVGSRALAAGKR